MATQLRADYTPAGPSFGTAFIDVDEWREEPRRHRYVHGGFEGTHTLFSVYLPPAELYQGRAFQYLEGGAGGHENLIAMGGYPGMGFSWMFDVVFDDLGGVLLESNQGHYHNEGLGFANDVELFGASAESARFAKFLAAEMYGRPVHHCYVWGGSGGGVRSAYCLENAPDVYAGASPHVWWPSVRGTSGGAQPWSAWANWWLYARGKRQQIMDATEPGGSGNAFAPLTNDEREALSALYRRGYPRGAESQLWSFGPWLFTMYGLKVSDPTYYHDFWNTAGYLGADSLDRLRPVLVDERFRVERVHTADASDNTVMLVGNIRMASAGAVSTPGVTRGASYAIELDRALDDPQKLCMAKVTVTTGTAAGREVYVSLVEGNTLFGFGEMAPDLFDGVAPGDEVHVDNHDFIAFAYLYRYDVDIDSYTQADADGQPRFPPEHGGLRGETVDHRPVFPQRGIRGSRTRDHTGVFEGKMIVVLAALDSMCWPGPSSYYSRIVRNAMGSRAADQFRQWWVEGSGHGAPAFLGPAVTPDKDAGVWNNRLVDYDGVTAEALRQLAAWAEDGQLPAASTGYHLTEDGGLVLATTPEARAGVQPLVRVAANAGARAEVRVGESVTFAGVAVQPPGAGSIVAAEWDFEGRGEFEPAAATIDGASPRCDVQASHTYARPGTYFAALRVGAHSQGAKGRGPAARNLARVRVVVT